MAEKIEKSQCGLFCEIINGRKDMLIFVIPQNYPNTVNRQASIFVYEQCKALASLGHEIIVLDAGEYSLKNMFKKTCISIVKEKDDFSVIYRYHVPMVWRSRLTAIGLHLYNRHLKKIFKRAVKEYGLPDVIYAHFSYPSGRCALKLAKKHNLPIAVIEHGGVYLSGNIKEYYKTNLKETLLGADTFIVVSESLKEAVKRHTKVEREICVIPNLIDDRFTYVPPVKKGETVFFAGGNLKPSKRFDLLIKAFDTAFSKDESVILNIAGMGKEYDKLVALIKELGREDQIKLLGRLSRDDMMKNYVECDCFVLLSEHETFGIVYREALAVGRPVIAADNGGIREGWESYFGEIVEKDNVPSAAAALKRMVKSHFDYPHKKIAQIMFERYSSNKIAVRVSEELNRIKKEKYEK